MTEWTSYSTLLSPLCIAIFAKDNVYFALLVTELMLFNFLVIWALEKLSKVETLYDDQRIAL